MPYNYQAVRRRYLPPRVVKVLFIGESAPSSNTGEIRFFYHPVLRSADNLFRGLMLALYGAEKHALASIPKEQWLTRFQGDGYYLDDLCPEPVNRLPARERSEARRSAATDLLKRIGAIAPQGIIICHQGTYDDIADLLREKHLPVLHAEAIPFPLGNYRSEFARAVRAALT